MIDSISKNFPLNASLFLNIFTISHVLRINGMFKTNDLTIINNVCWLGKI